MPVGFWKTVYRTFLPLRENLLTMLIANAGRGLQPRPKRLDFDNFET